MKFLMKLFFLFVFVVAGLVLARNVVAKAVLERVVPATTKFSLSLQKIEISLTRSFVDIETLKMKNPPGFHNTALADIPKIYVDFNFSEVLKGKIHLERLEFKMDQFTVVRNERGELNLDALKAVQSSKKESQRPSRPEPTGKVPAFRIDELKLKIGKVVFLDYSSGTLDTKEFLINIDQSYRDIHDPQKLVRLIVAKALVGTTIANLTNFDLGSLQGSVTGLLSSGTDMAGQVAGKGLDTLKSTAGTVAGTAQGLADAASGLKSKLKLPFGKSE